MTFFCFFFRQAPNSIVERTIHLSQKTKLCLTGYVVMGKYLNLCEPLLTLKRSIMPTSKYNLNIEGGIQILNIFIYGIYIKIQLHF